MSILSFNRAQERKQWFCISNQEGHTTLQSWPLILPYKAVCILIPWTRLESSFHYHLQHSGISCAPGKVKGLWWWMNGAEELAQANSTCYWGEGAGPITRKLTMWKEWELRAHWLHQHGPDVGEFNNRQHNSKLCWPSIPNIFKASITWKRVSWCDRIPTTWGRTITLKLNWRCRPFLLRWVLEMSYLY